MSKPSFREGVRNRAREAFIEQLHAEAPLYRDDAGFWVVSSFEDVREVLLGHERFSSRAMGGDGASRLPLLTDDPPRHSSLRGLISKAFTPGRIAQMRPEIEALAAGLVGMLEAGREVDIVAALTMPLPVTVIARMLGIPEADGERFKRWSDALTGQSGGGAVTTERARAEHELREFFFGVLAQRRAAPGSDLVSALARSEDASVQLSDDEIVGFAILLLIAGNETTTNLLGSLLHRLALAPALWSALRSDPSLVTRAIEETLRLDSPAQLILRRARTSTTLSGQSITEGDMLLVYLGAANRDPARWDSAGSFELALERERHIAFGFGVHSCIGAPLARLEAEVAMNALLARFEHIAPGEERPRRLASGTLFGFRSLPIVFR